MQPDLASATVRPITDADIDAVATFLGDHLDSGVPAAAWSRAMRAAGPSFAENHGFWLSAPDEGVVGAHLAFYSERDVAGRSEPFCNLGAWCVREEYRQHGLRLLRALLRQPGLHFTDFSPSGSVIPVNERLGFVHLDTATALAPNLPRPPTGGTRVVHDPVRIRQLLSGAELRRYEDHARAAAVHHLVLTRGGDTCYVMFRRDRRKGLPLFASLLHVSNQELFRDASGHVLSHLLLRHGIPLTLVELRVSGHRPRPSRMLRSPRPKMYKSPNLAPEQVDYLYSELTFVAW
jgi:hypothetical protein